MQAARNQTDVREEDKQVDRGEEHVSPTPWVSAEEMQPPQRPQCCGPLDLVDEASLESFPCSDPPCYSHAHA